MEYSPPPLFKQGASARAKVIVFAFLAISLLVVDARLRTLSVIRQGVAVALYPLQAAALMPRNALYAVGNYFSSLSRLEEENRRLRTEQVRNAQILQEGRQLLAENDQLRKLLSAAQRLPVKSTMAEILYDTRDAFTRKIVVDRGAQHGVVAGQPVIDDLGVVGQVTRVFPFTSEVTLLTDKDHAISVQVLRSGLRSVAYGRGQSGVLDLRYMPPNADIRKGDVLVTSGIDGVYPAGLSVASVTQVENKSTDAFAHIVCQPTGGVDRHKQLLILLVDTKLPPRPESDDDAKDVKGRKKPVGSVKESKDAVADTTRDDAGKKAPIAAPEAKAAAAATAPAATSHPPAAKVTDPKAAAPQAANAKAHQKPPETKAHPTKTLTVKAHVVEAREAQAKAAAAKETR